MSSLRRLGLPVVAVAAMVALSRSAASSTIAPSGVVRAAFGVAEACVGDSLGRPLPLIERPARDSSGRTLVILLTGDGGWARADEKMADWLVARGGAVVGLNLRVYLRSPRTPDETARAVACIAHYYLEAWRRERLMLVGYSRGADVAPFVVARFPDDLRSRIDMVALIGLGTEANFHFRLIDLVRDVSHPDDIPIAPELERLRGLNVVCLYGHNESGVGCRNADPTLVRRYERDGGHRLKGAFGMVGDVLASGLTPPPLRPSIPDRDIPNE